MASKAELQAMTKDALVERFSGNGGKKKAGITTKARGAMYAISFAGPAVANTLEKVQLKQTTSQIIDGSVKNITGRLNDGTFSWQMVGKIYGPGITWSIADLAASKLGVYKRMGRVLSSLA